MAKDKNEVATPEADEWQAKKKVAEMEELQKAIAQHNKTAAKAV